MKTEVVILGAGATGLTLAYELHKRKIPFALLETSSRTGGVIETHRENKFVFESGPNTLQLNRNEVGVLFEELGLQPVLPSENAKYRYILKNGRWCALPSSPLSLVTTRLFSVKDKLKLMVEPLRRRGHFENETLAATVVRRLGQSFLDYAIDPFVSGIYAGDPNELITRVAFPRLYNLEKNYGSFIRGAIHKKFDKTNIKHPMVTNKSITLSGGLETLIKTLEQKLPAKSIHRNIKLKRWKHNKNGLSIEWIENKRAHSLQTNHLVYCGSSARINDFLRTGALRGTELLSEPTTANVIQVSVGFHQWQGKKLDGFGLLAPSIERAGFLGVLFPSAIFSGRAPENGALLSFFFGGRRNPLDELESDTLVLKSVQKILAQHFETNKKPDLFRVFRYQGGIPQYDIGFDLIAQGIERLQNKFPGLHIKGNIRDGIGLPDRIVQAVQFAEQLAQST